MKKSQRERTDLFSQVMYEYRFFFLYLILPWYHLALQTELPVFYHSVLQSTVFFCFKKKKNLDQDLLLSMMSSICFTIWSQIRNYNAISNISISCITVAPFAKQWDLLLGPLLLPAAFPDNKSNAEIFTARVLIHFFSNSLSVSTSHFYQRIVVKKNALIWGIFNKVRC